MKQNDIQKRMQAAYKLISNPEIFSLEKLEAARDLAAGIDPKVDKAFAVSISAFSKVVKVQQKEILKLSAEALPEKTEVQKKRKKAILFFLTCCDELKSEIKRVQSELKDHSEKTKAETAASGVRIFAGAKGPFGIGTITALFIIGAMFLMDQHQARPAEKQVMKEIVSPSVEPKRQGIIVQDKIIPLTEVISTTGDECDRAMHYHAKDHIAATATDGSLVYDPGSCGFGKVKEVKTVDLQ